VGRGNGGVGRGRPGVGLTVVGVTGMLPSSSKAKTPSKAAAVISTSLSASACNAPSTEAMASSAKSVANQRFIVSLDLEGNGQECGDLSLLVCCSRLQPDFSWRGGDLENCGG
jgi:hypothetical protein